MLSSLPSALFLLVVSTVCRAAVINSTTRLCNGYAEFCNRSYGNITYAGAHDSYAFSSNPLALARTQEIDIISQLNLGVRLLQAQSHVSNGELHFCHTSCALFDGGTVGSYLDQVKDFLDNNLNEVLTLLFTNDDGASVTTQWDPLFQASGVANLAFVPSTFPLTQSEWPTLGEMIDSGKRVVVFMDSDSNITQVPYIMPEFEVVWETKFDSTNSSFPCTVDRIKGPLEVTQHLYLINHYLDMDELGLLIPDLSVASTTNGVDSILANANGCAGLGGGRNPNFVLMDWVTRGNASGAIALLNGVRDNHISGAGQLVPIYLLSASLFFSTMFSFTFL